MLHWYEIPGWFDFAGVYDEALARVQEPVIFVEVGSWLGRSTAYLAGRIQRLEKPVQFFAVDTWLGSPAEPGMLLTVETHGGDLFPQWQRNMKQAEVLAYVQPMQLASVDAARHFEANSIDFVFIDGEHTYDAVSADIQAWLPKLEPGGTLAGHDVDQEPVARAVRERLSGYRIQGRSWCFDKKD